MSAYLTYYCDCVGSGGSSIRKLPSYFAVPLSRIASERTSVSFQHALHCNINRIISKLEIIFKDEAAKMTDKNDAYNSVLEGHADERPFEASCFWCGGKYQKVNWHTPSGCPHCNRSFVE